MKAYQKAGAVISEDISEASVVFGVKQVLCNVSLQFRFCWSKSGSFPLFFQVPVDSLQSNKTFCFFSHTIKAQPDNMDLLDACLEKNIRLIDYEKLCEPETGLSCPL